MAGLVSAMTLFNINQLNGPVDSDVIDNRSVGKDSNDKLSQQEFLDVGDVLCCSLLGQPIDGRHESLP